MEFKFKQGCAKKKRGSTPLVYLNPTRMMTSVVFMEVMHFPSHYNKANLFSVYDFLINSQLCFSFSIFFFFLGPSDGFPLASNPIGNIPSTQLLQYESASCFVDSGSKYEEFYESYLKIDGATTFSADKTQENNLKASIPRLLPSVNKNVNDVSSPRKQSTLIMLSYKRKSIDGDEKTEICKRIFISSHPIKFFGKLKCKNQVLTND